MANYSLSDIGVVTIRLRSVNDLYDPISISLPLIATQFPKSTTLHDQFSRFQRPMEIRYQLCIGLESTVIPENVPFCKPSKYRHFPCISSYGKEVWFCRMPYNVREIVPYLCRSA